METNIHLFDLELIDPNPDQVDGTEDQAKVIEIAESLQRNRDNGTKGLLQVPTARMVDGRVQLAFGHTRKAAFALLAKDDPFWRQMPLILRDLTDLEMFEALAAENFKRRDASPIEKAKLMNAYMTKHGKTSVEAGAFFGVSEETVRGTVRFLNLPEKGQEALKEGRINITTARLLLSAQKIGGADIVEMALEDIAENTGSNDVFETPQDAVESAIHNAPNVQEMSHGRPWRDLEAKKFPVKYLKPLNRKTVAELLDVQNGDVARKELLDQIMQRLESGMEVTDDQFPAFAPDQLEKVRVLANPPACTSCQIHVALDNDHYCGFKLCYERKDKAWTEAEIQKKVKELEIPLYVNEAADGKYVELDKWEDADKKLFQDRHDDLRLMKTKNEIWNNFPGVPGNLKVVAVGKTAEKRLKAREKAAENGNIQAMDRQAQEAVRQLRDEFIRRFMWEVATPAFESLFDFVTNLPFMLYFYEEMLQYQTNADFPQGVDDESEQLDQIKSARKKAEGLKQLRRLMTFESIDKRLGNEIWNAKKPLVELGKQGQEAAAEWGVKLPKDWTTQAEKYQADFTAAVKALRKEKEAV